MASVLHIDWASKDCGKLEMSDKMPTGLVQKTVYLTNKKIKIQLERWNAWKHLSDK